MPTEKFSFKEFIELKDEEVSDLLSLHPRSKTAVIVPDGNRRAGLVFWNLNPSRENFDKDIFMRIHEKFLDVIKIFYDNGVKTLVLPLLLHRNFDRGNGYIEASMHYGLKHVFFNSSWLSFYEKNNIKIRFYGDRGFIKRRGLSLLLKWMHQLEESTAGNTGGMILYGIACGRSMEEIRLSSLSINLFKKTGKIPTRSELIKAYYGIHVPDIGFFIRSNELRDSDLQPILISGPKTQMYFPISPVALLSKKVIREILFDVIFNREATGGGKMYSEKDIDENDIKKIAKFYEMNRDSIIGTGIRKGSFWLPYNNIVLPQEIEVS